VVKLRAPFDCHDYSCGQREPGDNKNSSQPHGVEPERDPSADQPSGKCRNSKQRSVSIVDDTTPGKDDGCGEYPAIA
jgi:hypothetical protein